MAEQWQLCHVTVVTRVTISLGDLEISGNLSTAKKMPGNWPVVGEVSGNKSCGKLFISLLAGTPMFNRWFRPCLAFVRILVLLSNWYTHTHTFNGSLSGTTQVSRYQKGKTNLDFTGARDSEWQWHQLGHMQFCTSLQTNNHASTPPLSFLQAGCPSCCPTNSVKALKAQSSNWYCYTTPI